MITLINSVLCSKVIRDAETNVISLIELIENLNINHNETNELLNVPVFMSLFTHWTKQGDDGITSGIYRVMLQYPNNEIREMVQNTVDLSNHIFFRSIVQIAGIEVRGAGVYTFIIEIQREDGKWEHLSNLPVHITFNYQSPPQP